MIGDQNSRDYNVNVRLATVKWAMLEQIKNPSPCFSEVGQLVSNFFNYRISTIISIIIPGDLFPLSYESGSDRDAVQRLDQQNGIRSAEEPQWISSCIRCAHSIEGLYFS